ncbi:hypothetical protein vBKpPHS106_27 [Klebsiella phage VB_KpP_HS106]|nr:hypothetical protein vBKpPHS106_27 [Klebsiella phage VB_KpP_HS106]
MDANQAAAFINKFPGFIAEVPTAGHVAVKSVFWAGKLMYFPTKGTVDANGVQALTDVSKHIEFLKEQKGGIGTAHIILCALTVENFHKYMLKWA